MTLDVDVWAPRDDRERYRIYNVQHGEQRLVATAGDAHALGLCLVTLYEQGQITQTVAVGILDGIDHRWIVNPYAKPS